MKTYNSEKLKIQSLLSTLMMIVGILLMLLKIYVDSEPGALPLLFIIVGAVGYAITRVQLRSRDKTE
jgi:uncharacterized membrane protein